MICNKCNQPLPDDSEFCQYCGVKLESLANNEETVSNTAPVVENTKVTEEITEIHTPDKTLCIQQELPLEDITPIPALDKADKKKRFCKMCGGLIDRGSKKCTSCGKQYFKLHKLSKRTTIFMIICFILVSLNVFQCIFLAESRGTVSTQRGVIAKKNAEITQLKKDVEEYKKQAEENSKKAKFLDDYIVLIGEKNNKYHKYDCADFQGSFHAYNISAAKAEGYRACSKCN